MTWTLNATGACASEDEERALVEELNRVLSAPRSGTHSSGFTGEHHRGPAHGMPTKRQQERRERQQAAQRSDE